MRLAPFWQPRGFNTMFVFFHGCSCGGGEFSLWDEMCFGLNWKECFLFTLEEKKQDIPFPLLEKKKPEQKKTSV